eukprot:TRINITY_DN1744_c0_g1_i1.p1 TRINITY_DN1744_c0_g1~~TRINITY_DN1744_c0_g1_i1.p1  ORF type:complete len:213 (+),score=68.08 TRINITY_DN1744_c0_g1_i1:544-1182(+)
MDDIVVSGLNDRSNVTVVNISAHDISGVFSTSTLFAFGGSSSNIAVSGNFTNIVGSLIDTGGLHFAHSTVHMGPLRVNNLASGSVVTSQGDRYTLDDVVLSDVTVDGLLPRSVFALSNTQLHATHLTADSISGTLFSAVNNSQVTVRDFSDTNNGAVQHNEATFAVCEHSMMAIGSGTISSKSQLPAIKCDACGFTHRKVVLQAPPASGCLW